MNVIKLRTVDFYDTMLSWWEQHNEVPVAMDMLPEMTYVCLIGDTPVYSVCFYLTDSSLCWIAWPLSNKEVPYKDRAGALEYLFQVVEEDAQKQGFKFVFSTSGTKRVKEAFNSLGYEKGDINVNHYYKIL